MLERRKSRQAALEILYWREVSGGSVESLAEEWEQVRGRPLDVFALRLASGAVENSERIDELIQRYTDNWALERMPLLDRNIIRAGLYEMLFEGDIPHSVSINEAVELAKVFGTDDSSRFVNGILGRIALDLQESTSKR